MPSVADADEYERLFLEKYIRAQAKKRIEELEKRIKCTENSFEILRLRENIRSIEKDVEQEIALLKTNESLHAESLLGTKERLLEESFEYQNVKIPADAWSYLFEYQKEGVKWMIRIFNGKKGGVLADEMGLGKTVQVAAFVAGLVCTGIAQRFLVLCPATVIDQWESQLRKAHSALTLSKCTIDENRNVSILSYESFRSIDRNLAFDCVFLDEGHKIKNRNSLVSRAAKRIRARARFVITGTPIQNNLSELWSIFDFVNPSLLGSYSTFQEEFEDKIRKVDNERHRQISYQYSLMLKTIVGPYIMRRMKSQVSHMLPEKSDKVVFVTLSARQSAMYISALESRRFQNILRDGYGSKSALLGAIDHLRKICNHPLLIETLSAEHSWNELVGESCKMSITMELLDKWHSEGHRVLLFFQTVQMIRIFEKTLGIFRKDYKHLVMTGTTAMKLRSGLVDAFNTDESYFLFLLTTRVGGLGLNLTGANRVVIYDPDWNPSTDSQAKERIYRYGQQSTVEIYRLICRDTVEEKIYQKQIYKDCLSKRILSDANVGLDRNYVFDLFSYQRSCVDDAHVEPDKHLVVDDELVSVREEDKSNVRILMDLRSKRNLSGKELIELIERREMSLC